MDTIIFLGVLPILGFLFALILDFEKNKKTKKLRSIFLLVLSIFASIYFIKPESILEHFVMILVTAVFYFISFFASQDMFDKK